MVSRRTYRCTPRKKRISFEVSEEVATMWGELSYLKRKRLQKTRNTTPAHTMEKLIRDRYELLKAFGG